jgi:hypothetical protein
MGRDRELHQEIGESLRVPLAGETDQRELPLRRFRIRTL